MTGILTVSIFGSSIELGTFSTDFVVNITLNQGDIQGCTYPMAMNFLPIATLDDGECIFAGCTDVEASNFTPLATLEDGTCEYTADEDLCPADVDGNGTVNVSDLLGLLASFGEDCPSE